VVVKEGRISRKTKHLQRQFLSVFCWFQDLNEIKNFTDQNHQCMNLYRMEQL